MVTQAQATFHQAPKASSPNPNSSSPRLCSRDTKGSRDTKAEQRGPNTTVVGLGFIARTQVGHLLPNSETPSGLGDRPTLG